MLGLDDVSSRAGRQLVRNDSPAQPARRVRHEHFQAALSDNGTPPAFCTFRRAGFPSTGSVAPLQLWCHVRSRPDSQSPQPQRSIQSLRVLRAQCGFEFQRSSRVNS